MRIVRKKRTETSIQGEKINWFRTARTEQPSLRQSGMLTGKDRPGRNSKGKNKTILLCQTPARRKRLAETIRLGKFLCGKKKKGGGGEPSRGGQST